MEGPRPRSQSWMTGSSGEALPWGVARVAKVALQPA
jgi:hypothetical protein